VRYDVVCLVLGRTKCSSLVAWGGGMENVPPLDKRASHNALRPTAEVMLYHGKLVTVLYFETRHIRCTKCQMPNAFHARLDDLNLNFPRHLMS